MNELTIDDSQPVELYEFSSVNGNFYFTSDVLDWSADGNTYLSVSGLTRTKIAIGTQDNDKNELTVSIPTSVQVAYAWAFAVLPPQMDITIKRVDREGGGTYIIWKGKVSTIEVLENMAMFRCPTRFSSILTARVPTVVIQPQCNHILYDSRCGLNRNDYKYTADVTSVVGSILFIDISLPASNGTFGPNNDFLNGEVVRLLTGERRTITGTNFTGTSVTISYPLEIEVGESIEITEGCDHLQLSNYGCFKFNNLVNFGAFPLVPGEDKNIFTSGVF